MNFGSFAPRKIFNNEDMIIILYEGEFFGLLQLLEQENYKNINYWKSFSVKKQTKTFFRNLISVFFTDPTPIPAILTHRSREKLFDTDPKNVQNPPIPGIPSKIHRSRHRSLEFHQKCTDPDTDPKIFFWHRSPKSKKPWDRRICKKNTVRKTWIFYEGCLLNHTTIYSNPL